MINFEIQTGKNIETQDFAGKSLNGHRRAYCFRIITRKMSKNTHL